MPAREMPAPEGPTIGGAMPPPLLRVSLLGLNAGLALWLAVLVLRLVWRVHLLREADSNGAAQPRAARETELVVPHNAAAGAYAIVERVHIRSNPQFPLKDAKEASALEQLRADVRGRAGREGLHLGPAEQAVLADDPSCCRYLVARKWDVPGAATMLYGALAWRIRRAPPRIVTDLDSDDGRFLLSEGARGKVYCPPGVDRHGRGLLVLDNSVAGPYTSHAAAMRFLAFHIDFALRQASLAQHTGAEAHQKATPDVGAPDKLFILIKLNHFSLLNAPPLAQSRETLDLLMSYNPETMGHCVVYLPPRVFSGLWAFARNIIDTRMASKVVFINGSVEDGSPNDALLRHLCRDDWKAVLGCETPVLKQGCSPGYDPGAYWRSVVERERQWTSMLKQQSI